jgi:hypothetical protein
VSPLVVNYGLQIDAHASRLGTKADSVAGQAPPLQQFSDRRAVAAEKASGLRDRDGFAGDRRLVKRLGETQRH